MNYEIIGTKYEGTLTIVRECESFEDASEFAKRTFDTNLISIGLNNNSKYLPALKAVRTIPLATIVDWFNNTDVDYSNWSDLDMYIYYIEHSNE